MLSKNTPQVVTQVKTQSGSAAMSRNLTDTRESWSQVKRSLPPMPFKLSQDKLAAIYEAMRRENRQ